MRVLIVEDEKRLAEALAQILIKNKYIVDTAYDGEAGYDNAMSGIYDVIVLDVMLPGKNGFDVVSQMRKNGEATPVILLTAKDEIEDKVTGLDCGADDYLTKPFSTDELLARIRALCRRKGEVVSDMLSYSDISLHLSDYDLTCGGNSVHLGLKEFELLRLLLSSPNQVATKETLLQKVWGYDSDAEYNNVEVYISFLRKKLAYLKSRTAILTVRGVGYRLEETV